MPARNHKAPLPPEQLQTLFAPLFAQLDQGVVDFVGFGPALDLVDQLAYLLSSTANQPFERFQLTMAPAALFVRLAQTVDDVLDNLFGKHWMPPEG